MEDMPSLAFPVLWNALQVNINLSSVFIDWLFSEEIQDVSLYVTYC